MIVLHGVDSETGYKLFLDSMRGYLVELPVCACCGGAEKLSDKTKYNGAYLCLDCLHKLQRYRSSKTKVSRAGPTCSVELARKHLKHVQYWLEVKETTGIGPAGLEQEQANLLRYISIVE